MTKFNYKVMVNVIRGIFLVAILGTLIGCSSTMGVNLSVIPDQKTNSNMSENKYLGNVLVLITQGQSNQDFASVSPDSIGSLVMKNPTSFRVFHVSDKNDDFNLEVPVDPDKSVSVYVVGDGLVYNNDSKWKYYYNKLDDDTLDLQITPNGVIRKHVPDSWF